MNIRRAGLFGSAFFVAAALALAPATALAYNPNNHGHHYGQLKHQQPPPHNPPPAPGGNPVPASGPTVNSQLLTGGNAPAAQPATTTNPLPVSDPIEAVSAAPAKNAGNSWLLLLILPALLAVWLMVVGRGAVSVARLTRRTTAAA